MTVRGWVLLIAWGLLLAAGTVAVNRSLRVSADLRLFMPEPRNAAQRLLVQNIGESPASRLLLLHIDDARPADLARLSTALATSLAASPEFEFVANGTQSPSAIPESLLPFRYLVTDSFDAAPLDAATLERAFAERAEDMASPMSGFLEEWLPRDPTLEVLHLAERWQPYREPRRIGDVWFSRDGTRALLIAETRAAAFDPDGQARALDDLRTRFAALPGAAHAQLGISGSGFFSATIRNHTQKEATTIGIIETIALIALIWLSYRRWRFTLLGALPLLSGGLVGLVVVGLLFGTVHGITLVFGFTLIGVAQDYPIHLFSHLRDGESPAHTARSVWPPLLTGVASTCIAYLAFLLSGVTGLAQLACLTVSGLAVAALTTRFLLPKVVGDRPLDVANFPVLAKIDAAFARLPRPLALLAVIPLAFVAVLVFRSGDFWQNDLSRLTPVAPELLRADAELRAELATPDLRYLAVVSGPSQQAVLQHLEQLDAVLAQAVSSGSIAAADHAARYLPSVATQRRRQAALPTPPVLRAALDGATRDSGFDGNAFEAFVRDVEVARTAQPLTRESLAGTPLDLRVSSALFPKNGEWHGLVNFYDLKDPRALAARLAHVPNLTFLDLKRASEELVTAQRGHIIACLALAAVLLVVVIGLALRKVSRVMRVLAPMVLTTLLIITLLRAAGVSLSLFHLISLVLAAGLGLDYALFFEHAEADAAGQRRTLHALLVCSISTLMVFALLAFSPTPILRAIGVTVSIGVLSNFLLALLLTREQRA